MIKKCSTKNTLKFFHLQTNTMEPLVRERTPQGCGNATKFYSLDLWPKQLTDHKSRRKNWSVNITL